MTVDPSFPSPHFNPQHHLAWSTHPAGSCFSLPAPATASSWHDQLLLRAQNDKSSSQVNPFCVTDIPSYCGGTKGAVTTHHRLHLLGQTLEEMLFSTNWTFLSSNICSLRILEIPQVMQISRVKAIPRRESPGHSHVPPPQGHEAKLHTAFLLFNQTLLGHQEKHCSPLQPLSLKE